MSETPLELGLVVDGDDTWLVAPAVGLFTEALAAGADDYVMKPFDHETLQIKLQLVGMG